MSMEIQPDTGIDVLRTYRIRITIAKYVNAKTVVTIKYNDNVCFPMVFAFLIC